MKLSDIVDIESTKGISTKDLRKMTQQLQDAANKRLKRLIEDPIGRLSIRGSRAYEKLERGESPYWSMIDLKSRDSLRARFRQLQSFIGNTKTGSLKAFKKYYKGLEEKLGGTLDSTGYKAFRELMRQYPDGSLPGGYDSWDVQRLLIQERQEDDDWTTLYDKVITRLKSIYEKSEEEDEPEFYEPVENDEDLPF